jgi:predicted TIM-barrel fold metal-dependent hydrolase
VDNRVVALLLLWWVLAAWGVGSPPKPSPVANGDVRLTHVYFDVSGVAGLGEWEQKADLIARRIRQLGVHRILYGSDGAVGEYTPQRATAAFRQLPLSVSEFEIIENTIAPYMR